jgi:hypothetical protein
LVSDIREEHNLRVFENRVLRRIFGPKRDEVTGGWRKLHNEKLHNLYSSPSVIRMIKSKRMRWARHVAWMNNIKTVLRETGWDGMDWIDLAQDRDQWRALVNTVTNVRVPQNAGKFLSSCTIGGFSRRALLHEVS